MTYTVVSCTCLEDIRLFSPKVKRIYDMAQIMIQWEKCPKTYKNIIRVQIVKNIDT